MGSFERKVRRNELKRELGTNKIKEFYHSKYDTLEQRLIRGMINAKKKDK